MFNKYICASVFTSLILFSNFSLHAVKPEDMSLEQKIGQMLCLDFRFWDKNETCKSGFESSKSVSTNSGNQMKAPVTEVNSEIKKIISKYHIGGVILFSQNFANEEQSKQLIKDLKETASKAGSPPLLICVDQEGGRVERFKFGRERLKDNLEIGNSENPEKAAFEKGEIIGQELSDLGINCNLAPVVDINSNPENPVIGTRSFGKSAEVVSKCGISFMNGLHSHNILSAAKHFPGHGDTKVDSHFSLPRVDKNIEELNSLELMPFKEMIDSGVDMIMTAHIEFPQIERSTIISKKDGKKIFIPATLSKTILTGLLRNKLDFKGVIITDAMNMKAISENVGEEDAVKMAISAGANIICMPVTLTSSHDTVKLDNIFKTVKSAILNKEIKESEINSSVERILDLKSKI